MGDTQQGQLDGAALQQQHQQPPAAEEVQVQQQADVQQQPHLNGLDQHSREADAAPADKEQLPAVCCAGLTKSVQLYSAKHEQEQTTWHTFVLCVCVAVCVCVWQQQHLLCVQNMLSSTSVGAPGLAGAVTMIHEKLFHS